MTNEVTRWDLTEDVATGIVDVTPVPHSMGGRFVTYEDYDKLAEDYAALQERYDLDVNPEGK
ncbi:hypothetical protein HOU72_gp32 [Pectobacterium phage Khlen]|uniref:Uncharacterized protein n=1 Tax=Pectobacterium phage Khlen TaxID=2489627 RepID=A0A3G8FID2_9CAUD|nr:hypothetical protein HOU72_gp32 [Pectobacterium phage Khlen]AZF94563.1 hypothetical protein [Pectobacterium phage Khlen]